MILQGILGVNYKSGLSSDGFVDTFLLKLPKLFNGKMKMQQATSFERIERIFSAICMTYLEGSIDINKNLSPSCYIKTVQTENGTESRFIMAGAGIRTPLNAELIAKRISRLFEGSEIPVEKEDCFVDLNSSFLSSIGERKRFLCKDNQPTLIVKGLDSEEFVQKLQAVHSKSLQEETCRRIDELYQAFVKSIDELNLHVGAAQMYLDHYGKQGTDTRGAESRISGKLRGLRLGVGEEAFWLWKEFAQPLRPTTGTNNGGSPKNEPKG